MSVIRLAPANERKKNSSKNGISICWQGLRPGPQSQLTPWLQSLIVADVLFIIRRIFGRFMRLPSSMPAASDCGFDFVQCKYLRASHRINDNILGHPLFIFLSFRTLFFFLLVFNSNFQMHSARLLLMGLKRLNEKNVRKIDLINHRTARMAI